MFSKRMWLPISCLLLLWCGWHVQAEVPQVINYQGCLTDGAGNPVADGNYQITFTIYDAASGGSTKWTSGPQTVPVENGLFAYQLQFGLAYHDLFTDTLRWLGIKVGTDPEIIPRSKLMSSPYAYHALRADTAAVALSGVGGSGGWTDDGNVVRLTTSTDSVGIGTNNPSEKLHVEGAVYVSDKAIIGPGHTSTGTNGFVAGRENRVEENYSTVSGGRSNAAIGSASAVGGGTQDTASGDFSAIGGGNQNTARGGYSFVGGGQSNNAKQYFSAILAGKENYTNGSYSIVGGGASDSAKAAYGGVFSGYANKAGDESTDTAAFIGGGYLNTALDMFTAITGGYMNNAEGIVSYIGGGSRNHTDEMWCTIGGGDANGVLGRYGTIAGGLLDTVHSIGGTVGGGKANHAIAGYSTVSGGFDNHAGGYPDSAFGDYSTVGGGTKNRAYGENTTVSGGNENWACNKNTTVAGGNRNHACDTGSTVSGGYYNYNGGFYSVISGGYENSISGAYNAIPGGLRNAIGSLAPPYPAFSMVFGDSVWIEDSFRVVFFNSQLHGRLGVNRDKRDGGILYPIHVGTMGDNNGNGAHLTEGGTWISTSSRDSKENFQSMDARLLLQKITELNIQAWNYKNTDERHIGPVAEDFVEAFDVGNIRVEDGKRDDHYLAAGDVAGVALIGIQELYRITQELREKTDKIELLESQLAELQTMVDIIWAQRESDENQKVKLVQNNPKK